MCPKRIKLETGKRSGANLTHVIPREIYFPKAPDHVIIAGSKTRFRNTSNGFMVEASYGGTKGTLHIYVSGRIGTIGRDVPEKFRNGGIGTDLLEAAEKVGRHYGLWKLSALTNNPVAEATYKKCGWKLVGELGGGFKEHEKVLD